MPELSSEGRKIVEDLARRHGVGSDAVAALLYALELGNGAQAQFNNPDLGGLKHRVDALCREAAALLRSQPILNRPEAGPSQWQGQSGGCAGVSLFIPASGPSARNWWPEELGSPASTGAQNNLNYAYFPVSRRLAIRRGDQVSVYDTGEHRIYGFSQQQSGDQSLTFTSQHGLVRVADLPLVKPGASNLSDPISGGLRAPVPPQKAAAAPLEEGSTAAVLAVAPAPASTDDLLKTIERLSDLHQKDILTDAEFAAKKAELLSRL